MPKYTHHWGLPGDSSDKGHACQCRRLKRHGLDPWMWKIPWRRAWQPTPVFLPGESHGHRGLVGYSLENCKESDTTDVTQHTYTSLYKDKWFFWKVFLCFKQWCMNGQSDRRTHWCRKWKMFQIAYQGTHIYLHWSQVGCLFLVVQTPLSMEFSRQKY